MEPQYLGDGVYISPWPEMAEFVITTGTHEEQGADDVVYLEPEVAQALLIYLLKSRESN